MKRQWTSDELIDEWMVTAEEEALLDARSLATRLGFAVLLKYFQHEGRFPQHRSDVPAVIVGFLARRLEVPVETFLRYDWQGHTIKRHRVRIRSALGVRITTVDDAAALRAWLCADILPHERHSAHVIEAVYAECRARHLEPPTPASISRLVRSALRAFERQLFATTMQRLSSSSRAALERLLGATSDDEDRPNDGAAGTAGAAAAQDIADQASLDSDAGTHEGVM